MIVWSGTLLFPRRHSVPSPKSTPGSTNSPRQLDVLLHDGHPLSVNGAEICIFEQVDHECFGGLLECLNGHGLPAQDVTAYVDKREGNFADEAGKG